MSDDLPVQFPMRSIKGSSGLYHQVAQSDNHEVFIRIAMTNGQVINEGKTKFVDTAQINVIVLGSQFDIPEPFEYIESRKYEDPTSMTPVDGHLLGKIWIPLGVFDSDTQGMWEYLFEMGAEAFDDAIAPLIKAVQGHFTHTLQDIIAKTYPDWGVPKLKVAPKLYVNDQWSTHIAALQQEALHHNLKNKGLTSVLDPGKQWVPKDGVGTNVEASKSNPAVVSISGGKANKAGMPAPSEKAKATGFLKATAGEKFETPHNIAMVKLMNKLKSSEEEDSPVKPPHKVQVLSPADALGELGKAIEGADKAIQETKTFLSEHSLNQGVPESIKLAALSEFTALNVVAFNLHEDGSGTCAISMPAGTGTIDLSKQQVEEVYASIAPQSIAEPKVLPVVHIPTDADHSDDVPEPT